MTNFEYIRNRLLQGKEYLNYFDLEKVRDQEWSKEFEELMRNRLVLGSFRYGKLGAKDKPNYNRVSSISKRLALYQETGNKEYLVDIAAIAMVEFVESKHPKAHFRAQDDSEHVETIKENIDANS